MLGGQILLTAADPREFVLFGIASVALSLSLVPIAMTRTQAPVPTAAPRMRLRALLAVSPLGAIGCIASGICLGSFWAISPVFAREAGLDRVGVALFMAATVLGGLLAQWPVGRTSDQYDRRIVIVIASGLAAAFAAYIAAMPTSRIALLAAAIAYGAVLFPLYSLCLAHANDFSSPEDMLSLGSGLLLLYGIGAAVGPLLGGIVMGAVGAHGPYAASAIILLATAGYAVYRTRERPSPEEKESFVFAPRTTPAAFALDPRAETGEPELPFDEESQD
jgi:predicted MFS family arabinose efflux permease